MYKTRTAPPRAGAGGAMDLTDTIVRQLVIFGDESDLRRIPAGCGRYFLQVFVFMEDEETLSALPEGLLYDPRRAAVYAATPQDLARGVLRCMHDLGRTRPCREATVLEYMSNLYEGIPNL